MALRGMIQENVYVGVFQETTFTEVFYTQRLAGYRVVAMPAPILHQGGVAIFYQDSLVFAVEAIFQFGANVIACQLVTVHMRLYIVVCYLSLSDRTNI